MAKNEVAKNQTMSDLPANVAQGGWGTEGVDSSDILIPKLLMMQGLSKLVSADKAQMGDIVNSVTNEVLGTAREKDRKPVTIIPIMTYKTWVEHEIIGDKRKFLRIIPMDKTNADLPNESEGTGELTGKLISRDRALNFYVLVKGDESGLPYAMTFKRTSYRTGQKLATHFKTCELAALRGKPVPPAATTFNVCGNKVTNDDGTFYVLDIEPGEKTTGDDLQRAYEWWMTLKKSTVKVDNSDLTTDSAAEATFGATSGEDDRY
jgi:hypothetical protein